MNERRRAVFVGLRFGMLAAATIATVYAGPRTFTPLHTSDDIALALAFAMFVLLLRINVPAMSSLYGRRRYLEPGRLTLETPVVVAIFTIYGPFAAAAMQLAGYPLAIPSEGRSRFMRRILDGGSDAFVWICFGLLQPLFLSRIPEFSARGYGTFVLFFTAGIFAFLAFLWMPLKTLTERVTILRLWGNVARDTRLLTYTMLMLSWGYVCTMIWMRAGSVLGLVCFAPLPFIASAMRAIHRQHAELHRLRLARDAVQAMLRTNDPLPQMNSLLASLHTPAAEETLQIYASLTPDEHLTPLATIGPIPDANQLESVRRALAELQHASSPSVSLRGNRQAVTAYPVRSSDEQLLGALVVHRTARTSSVHSARRFSRAAAELAPLLRDFRAIAATQNAARVDALTGLPNRRTILEMLRERVESVSLDNPCAVLLLDIDHFKNVNDTLGHQAGDNCLRTVSAIIARNIRSVDRAGRIGGEEFVILMPDTTSEMARNVGERLRAAIENADVRHANGDPVTASIGVAVAAISDTVDSLLARADRALYQAKRQGRNRVIEIGA